MVPAALTDGILNGSWNKQKRWEFCRMHTIKHAVVSMAGFGSRLGKNLPKGLVELGSHRLVWYLLQVTRNIPDLRIVVGFKAQEVIDYVKTIRPDVNFILNSDYASTSCAYSIDLGSRDLTEPFLIIDGDLLLVPDSFQEFVSECEKTSRTLVGVTPAKTEQAVFAETNDEDGTIRGFTRTPGSKWEWSGVAFVDFPIDPQERFICDTLAKKLPLKYHPIQCFEIDTPADHELAQNYLRSIESY